jgi:hypothetical protein
MAVTRRGGAFALALALLGAGVSVGGCQSTSGNQTVPPPQTMDLSATFQSCTSVCVRPSDCAMAFNDDGICPPGFLCATRFSCHD